MQREMTDNGFLPRSPDRRPARGVLYSLVALGFVLIFKASGVFNFAQGAMVLTAALALVRALELFSSNGTGRSAWRSPPPSCSPPSSWRSSPGPPSGWCCASW